LGGVDLVIVCTARRWLGRRREDLLVFPFGISDRQRQLNSVESAFEFIALQCAEEYRSQYDTLELAGICPEIVTDAYSY